MLEQDNVIPDQGEPVDGTINLAKELFDKISDITNRFSGRVRVNYPDGSYAWAEIYSRDDDKKGPKKYRLAFFMYYHPNGDNPIIPNDMLTLGVREMQKFIIKNVPEIETYSKEVLDEFTFALVNDSVYYKEGILSITNPDLMLSSERNRLLSDYPFYTFIHKIEPFSLMYYLENPLTFGPDYSLAMDRAIKKLKSVWSALKKGKFRGTEYEYTGSPTYNVHQRTHGFNKENKVLNPDFSLAIATGWVKINGKSINEIDDAQFKIDFENFITKKFQHFGIRLS